MPFSFPPTSRLSIFLLSAATLAFEINLTRLFSVAQFYHFAFLIVSLALLGFGASGTALAVFPKLGRSRPQRTLSRLSLSCAASLVGAYLLINNLPFDSFSVAWDWRQTGILTLHLLALAAPFFFSGMGVGLMLSAAPHAASQTYAVNLAGAALGCVIAWIAPARLGGEGIVTLCASLAAGASWLAVWGEAMPVRYNRSSSGGSARPSFSTRWLAVGILMVCLLDLGLRLTGRSSFDGLTLRLSPYKGLSYALQYPRAQMIYQQWNAFSRVDVVSSAGVRSLPGLSYLSPHPPPPEHGLLVDGDDLNPIVLPDADTGFADYMPSAIAYQLRPQAQALVLAPRGGLDVVIALALGAQTATAVEVNPLVVEAVGDIYADPRVRVIIESDRSYLRRSRERFNVVVFSLITAQHPVRSGAYSLAENYRYTVEAFEDALTRLNPDGLLVVTRWLQTPPSEELRAFALAVTAVERAGGDPATHIIAFRGYNTGTLLVKNGPFSPAEVDAVRAFANSRAFDLTYAPGLRPDEVNQHNVLPAPIYYQTFTALLNADPRQAWYAAYPFDVRPPTDDRPFFGQFFKWSQAPQVVAELGKTWQPFGGAGYLILLVLLGLVTLMAATLILLPLAAQGRRTAARTGVTRLGLMYFGWLGLAFLLIEIPLVQRFILFLGHPAHALTAVLFTLLLFSGFGSLAAPRLAGQPALAALVLMAIGLPWLLPHFFALSLGLPFTWRLIGTMMVLAPLGFLMGLPFPLGLRWLEREAPDLIPWAWGVNGAASVVASVLAALLALSFGFSWVLAAGAGCYAGAWLTARRWAARDSSPRP